MRRRDFLKLVGVLVVAPSLPVVGAEKFVPWVWVHTIYTWDNHGNMIGTIMTEDSDEEIESFIVGARRQAKAMGLKRVRIHASGPALGKNYTSTYKPDKERLK